MDAPGGADEFAFSRLKLYSFQLAIILAGGILFGTGL
jgi:hypothetical protein